MRAARSECAVRSARKAGATDSGSRHPARYGQNDCAIVLGRKAWLFSDTPAGADASARLYSVIETAKASNREPYTYLRHVFTELPKAVTADDVEALLPWNTVLPATQRVAA
ncbi:MAG: hypothetical protein B7Y80_20970 [Hyphomicrobium sp. 32-62-53]|nr:MAG: hypothetical protein B7Z29_21045 [Hyphomicrobium sp. 12-62-95]OYX97085.1 MAG: hypothetical protein B7Y80_20970 [Hyphomicrobium sp. 32-62-53]